MAAWPADRTAAVLASARRDDAVRKIDLSQNCELSKEPDEMAIVNFRSGCPGATHVRPVGAP